MNLEDLTKTPLPTLRPREPASHKGNFGHALLIGGSRGMSGAIAMAGLATLRSGAGRGTGRGRQFQSLLHDTWRRPES